MILSIVAYGHPALRKETQELAADHPALETLLENMFETMYNAQGVGLAAPQVGLSLRLFVVDGSPMEGAYEGEEMEGFKKVFINPVILEETGDEWSFDEGCLSIPDVREEIYRQDTVTIRYYDENFQEQTETFDGMKARIIQHEYDHLEGVLFTDYLSALRKRMLKGKLSRMAKGEAYATYPMKFGRPRK